MKMTAWAICVLLVLGIFSCKEGPYSDDKPGTVTYRVYGTFDLVDPPLVPSLDITVQTAHGGAITYNFIAADMPAAPTSFDWLYQTDYVEGQPYSLRLVVNAIPPVTPNTTLKISGRIISAPLTTFPYRIYSRQTASVSLTVPDENGTQTVVRGNADAFQIVATSKAKLVLT